MARDGMSNLIKRLRQMTETSTGDYTLGSETYWTDDHLQEVLDGHRTRLDHVKITPRPEYTNGAFVYLRYELPKGINAVEGVTADDKTAFKITDSTGTLIAQANYTLSERDMSVVFADDQAGEARYWSGFAYDMISAAREIWLAKAAHVHAAINFSVDWQKFDREALYKHCLEMAQHFGYSQGSKMARLVRSDLLGSEKDRF